MIEDNSRRTKMGKIINLVDVKKTKKWHEKRLAAIKEELLQNYNIDLDKLLHLANEPLINLSMEEFEELTERIMDVIDDFCEKRPNVTVQDLFFVLDSVKEIIRENAEYSD